MNTHARRIPILTLCAALPAAALLWSARPVSGDAAAKPKRRIALVANNASDFWNIVRRGAEKAARQAKVDLVFARPNEGTAFRQGRIVDDALARGVDGIAISPVDAPNQADMLRRVAESTLLFTFDSDAPRSPRACFVGTDNVAAGRAAGREIKRVLPWGGSILLFVGRLDSANYPSARERYEGLTQELRGSNVRILGVRTDDTNRARAKSNVADALVEHPKLAACVGLWSYNGPAIWSAVRDARKTGRVKIIAFDDEEDTLEGVARGDISATIVQQPFLFGQETVRAMAQVLAGDRNAIPASKQISLPTLSIRQSDVAGWRARLNALRHP